MRTILIAVIALLVLGGGGAGAYFYFTKPAEAALTEGEQGKKKAEKKEDIDKTKFEYVELDPLILPIIDANGVNQVVSLVVALEVSDAKKAEKVTNLSPRLKDAYIQDMYGMLNDHAAMKGGVVQVAKLKKRLNEVSTKVLGEDVIHDVLLQVVQQRPI